MSWPLNRGSLDGYLCVVPLVHFLCRHMCNLIAIQPKSMLTLGSCSLWLLQTDTYTAAGNRVLS